MSGCRLRKFDLRTTVVRRSLADCLLQFIFQPPGVWKHDAESRHSMGGRTGQPRTRPPFHHAVRVSSGWEAFISGRLGPWLKFAASASDQRPRSRGACAVSSRVVSAWDSVECEMWSKWRPDAVVRAMPALIRLMAGRGRWLCILYLKQAMVMGRATLRSTVSWSVLPCASNSRSFPRFWRSRERRVRSPRATTAHPSSRSRIS